ncbi:MAG TPA: nitroreductase [bacterium]|nr:nitroreductase [bacterium]
MPDPNRAAAVLDVIRSRRSVPKLKPDPVPYALVERLLDAAVWAPNHRVTEPWQFFVLDGEAKRRFAEIRRDARRKAMPNPDAPEVQAALDKVYRDAAETPLIIAVTSAMPEDLEAREEDIWATYGAAYAFMLGAWAEGLGTYYRTGAIRDDPALRRLLNLPDNRRVIGIIYAGYPVEVPTRRRTPATEKTVWLR